MNRREMMGSVAGAAGMAAVCGPAALAGLSGAPDAATGRVMPDSEIVARGFADASFTLGFAGLAGWKGWEEPFEPFRVYFAISDPKAPGSYYLSKTEFTDRILPHPRGDVGEKAVMVSDTLVNGRCDCSDELVDAVDIHESLGQPSGSSIWDTRRGVAVGFGGRFIPMDDGARREFRSVHPWESSIVRDNVLLSFAFVGRVLESRGIRIPRPLAA